MARLLVSGVPLAVWLAVVSAVLLSGTTVVRCHEPSATPAGEPHRCPADGSAGAGVLNLTAEEAGTFALIAICLVAAVGLLCVVMCATACGYRAQTGVLTRRIRSLEKALLAGASPAADDEKHPPPASPPSTVVYADPATEAGDEFPPPPPDGASSGDEDVKPPLPQTEVEMEPYDEGEQENEAYEDDDVEAALTNMDAAVEEDPTDA